MQGKGGVDVLFDKEQITEGARWREVIHAMLAECDAAIILVTPDALQSFLGTQGSYDSAVAVRPGS